MTRPDLMDRFGLLYEEITASNLITVDEHGNVLEGPTDVNTAGFVIHSAIHLHHPNAKFVFHAHAAGLPLDSCEPSLRELSRKQYEAFSPRKYEWPALVRRCDRLDPSYKF